MAEPTISLPSIFQRQCLYWPTLSFLFFLTIVSTHSLRDNATPIEYRGRVYGCITGILTPAALVSFLAGSYLAGIVGVEKVLIGAGALGIATLVVAQMQLAGPAPTPSGASTGAIPSGGDG